MRHYEPFAFKQFKVYQQDSAMKVGTDAVLLGAYVSLPGSSEPIEILDVGSGTGVVGLMLAQRASKAQVTCLEIDPKAVQESQLSVAESPFSDRISVVCGDFEEYVPSKVFDLIVSNPPFFTDTHWTPDGSRNQARHIGALTPEVLFRRAKSILKPSGRVVLIVARSTFERFCVAAEEEGLILHDVLMVRPLQRASVKRIVASWCLDQVDQVRIDELFIEISRHHYSERFRILTEAFYLDKKRPDPR